MATTEEEKQRNDILLKLTQMQSALPTADLIALERVVWSMSRSSDRKTVYKSFDKYRMYVQLETIMSSLAIFGAQQACDSIEGVLAAYGDKISIIVYSESKFKDPMRGGKTRKHFVEEMKTLLENVGLGQVIEKVIITTDTPVRNQRTIINADIFNLPSIIKTLDLSI